MGTENIFRSSAPIFEPLPSPALSAQSELSFLAPPVSLSGALISSPKAVRLATIPTHAEIVYHKNEFVYVMDRDGTNVTQITFTSHTLEHVAVSYDRRYVAANEIIRSEHNRSRLWVFDLEKGTKAQLVPTFESAGAGGVDWDRNGFIYFAGQEIKPAAPLHPKDPKDILRAMLGTFQVYKVKYDGTDLRQLTNGPNTGAADVRVSRNSKMVSFTTATFGEGVVVQIYVLNTDGTNLRKVPNAFGHDPQLSPDEKKIVFTRPNDKATGREKNQQVWIVNLDGTGLARVTPEDEWALAPDWSDTSILYTAAKDAVLINTDGTGKKVIRPDALVSKWIPSK